MLRVLYQLAKEFQIVKNAIKSFNEVKTNGRSISVYDEYILAMYCEHLERCEDEISSDIRRRVEDMRIWAYRQNPSLATKTPDGFDKFVDDGYEAVMLPDSWWIAMSHEGKTLTVWIADYADDIQVS